MHKPAKIFYIMGVSGSGKSTFGKLWAEEMGIPFVDGDDFHPEANIQKMASGQALNDHDRQGWLKAIHQYVLPFTKTSGLVVACSALKDQYRKLLAEGIEKQVVWVFLHGSFELILKRMNDRSEHFMPPALLQSQFDTLEIPKDAIVLDIQESPAVLIHHLANQLA